MGGRSSAAEGAGGESEYENTSGGGLGNGKSELEVIKLDYIGDEETLDAFAMKYAHEAVGSRIGGDSWCRPSGRVDEVGIEQAIAGGGKELDVWVGVIIEKIDRFGDDKARVAGQLAVAIRGKNELVFCSDAAAWRKG